MREYSVSKRFGCKEKITGRMTEVMRMFGVRTGQLAEHSPNYECRVKVDEGDIVYITGPSGSGKSVLLGELERAVPAGERINLKEIKPNGWARPASDKTLIDCIEGDVLAGLRLLSTAGLNDVFCVLSRPANLSEGQRYRFRLAMALAAGKKFIFADEFCSNLDRITAAVVAYNIRKFAKKTGVIFMLAGSCEDILADLLPDVLIVKELSGPAEVIYSNRPMVIFSE